MTKQNCETLLRNDNRKCLIYNITLRFLLFCRSMLLLGSHLSTFVIKNQCQQLCLATNKLTHTCMKTFEQNGCIAKYLETKSFAVFCFNIKFLFRPESKMFWQNRGFIYGKDKIMIAFHAIYIMDQL